MNRGLLLVSPWNQPRLPFGCSVDASCLKFRERGWGRAKVNFYFMMRPFWAYYEFWVGDINCWHLATAFTVARGAACFVRRSSLEDPTNKRSLILFEYLMCGTGPFYKFIRRLMRFLLRNSGKPLVLIKTSAVFLFFICLCCDSSG